MSAEKYIYLRGCLDVVFDIEKAKFFVQIEAFSQTKS